MQTHPSRSVAINLKRLIAVEILILGFCLWLACALHTHAEIPLWYQSAFKSVLALLLTATMPLVPVSALRWKVVKRWLLSAVTTLFTASATLVVLYANMEIASDRDRFAINLLAAAAGLATAGYLRRGRSA